MYAPQRMPAPTTTLAPDDEPLTLPGRLSPLSRREAEILSLVAIGSSVEEMSSALFLSPHTVRTHVKNIRRKLHANTKAHAVALACAYGLISPRV
jgi:DNA-binding CsgD family transcriptional regulator